MQSRLFDSGNGIQTHQLPDRGNCSDCGDPLIFANEISVGLCSPCRSQTYCGVRGGLKMIGGAVAVAAWLGVMR